MKTPSLAALLALLLIVPGQAQNTVDDWPNLPPGAVLPILPDGTASVSGRIQYATDTDAFNFMVASPAQLTVYTTGTTDTNGVLKRASLTAAGTQGWETVAAEESGTENFRISRRVEPGQYAIQVGGRISTTSTGAYGLRVELAPVVTTPPDIDLADAPKGSVQDFGEVDAGATVRKVFTLKNTGGSSLSISSIALLNSATGSVGAPFLLESAVPRTIAAGASSTFAIQFRPLAAGAWTGTVRVVSNDPDESPWDFSVTGRGKTAVPPQVPEIAAFSGNAELQSGGTVSFGLVPVPSATDIVREVVIANKGSAALSLGSVRIELLPLGAPLPSAPDGFFKVLSQPAAVLEAGRSTVVRLGAGLREVQTQAALSRFAAYAVIENNDADENPFRIQLTAEPQIAPPPGAPELDLFAGTAAVASGSAIDMGSGSPTAPVSKVFVILNTGTAALSLTGISVPPAGINAGATAGPFLVEGGAPRLVPPGAATEFRVTLRSAIPGTFTGGLKIGSDDSDENPYLITLTGTITGDPAATPEIAVSAAGADLPTGGTLDFGTAAPLETVRRTIRVANSGTGVLNVRFALQQPRSDLITIPPFRFLSAPFASVPAGGAGELTLGFQPPAADSYSVTLVISSNDADENPYSIRLTGVSKDLGTRAPEIALSQGNAEIASGGMVDFGSTIPGRSVIRELQIANRGDGMLKLGQITFSRTGDAPAADGNAGALRTPRTSPIAFRLMSPASVLVPPGGRTVLKVLFMPQAAGAHQAVLCIESNDADENPYKVNLKGTGTGPVATLPEIGVFAGDAPLPAGSALDFGDVKIGTPVRRTVRIANTGTGDLRISSFLIMPAAPDAAGADGGVFIPTAALVRIVSGVPVIAPGASGEFVLEMFGYSPGPARLAARIANNDSDENPYGFMISGNVSSPVTGDGTPVAN